MAKYRNVTQSTYETLLYNYLGLRALNNIFVFGFYTSCNITGQTHPGLMSMDKDNIIPV